MMYNEMSSMNQTEKHPHYPGRSHAGCTNRNIGKASESPAKMKVLVTDDEQVIADTLAMILNRSGFEAMAVYSGTAAINALNSFQPDILVSDVMMPGMTGIEAAIVIRTQRPSCKVLLFSGKAATAELLHESGAQGHCFEVLTKPIHPADLLAKLRPSMPVAASA